MRVLIMFVVIVFAITFSTSSASAKVGDKAWAACVWNVAPVSADAWLRMDSPEWSENMESASERLGFRIFAICNEDSVDKVKPNRLPNWKALRSTLKASRPKENSQLAAVLNRIESRDVETKFCRHFAIRDNARTLYLIDVTRSAKGSNEVVFQQYFSKIGEDFLRVFDGKQRPVSFEFAGVPSGGTLLRMPQDLKVAPVEGTATEVVCSRIDASGALENA